MSDELKEIKNLIEEVIGKLKYIKDEYGLEEEWPKVGDRYWYIGDKGVGSHTWRGDPIDREIRENNGIFKTEEEALNKLEDDIIKKYAKPEPGFKDGDSYWSIDDLGLVERYRWDGDLFDRKMFKIGNVFKTEEEAEFMLEKLKVIQELKQLARPFKYGKDNHLIHYDYYAMKFEIFECITSQGAYGDYYFNSYDEAKEAVDKIGAERIKKYLFGVE